MSFKKCVAIGLLLITTGCTTQRKERFISEKEFGKEWPLTVSSGTLVCTVIPVENRSIFFISPDGKQYDVIGSRYRSIFHIVKPAPPSSGYKFFSTELLLKKGMKLCPEPFWLAPP